MYAALRQGRRFSLLPWALALGVVVAAATGARAELDGITQAPLKSFDPIELLVAPFYNERLSTAPASVRMRLKNIQDDVRQNNYTFSVGYTDALDIPLNQLAKTVMPPDFLESAKKQDAFVKDALPILGEAPPYGSRRQPGGQSSASSGATAAATCAGAGSCNGGYYTPVFKWMLTHGVADVAADRYQAKDTTCTANVKKLLTPYKADLWGY